MERDFSINKHQHNVMILCEIILLVILLQVLGSTRTPALLRSSNDAVPEAHKQKIAKDLAGSFGLGPFQPSLEMKENADFLLTPALLVQEAICDDIIITYPTE